MNTTIKSIAALSILAFATPALAGGVTVAEDGASKLKLSAKFFVNGTKSKTTGDGTVAGNNNIQSDSIGIALDRAYLTALYTFNDTWSMKLTSDATLESKAGLGKRTNVFIKHAFLRGNFSDKIAVDAGVIGTSWIGYNDKLYKHRYVQKSFTDEYKMDSSADAGISVHGTLADGLFKYHIAEVNGGGYGNISKSKGIDLDSRVGIYPVEGLTIDVQFRDGYKGSKTWDKATQANFAGTKHQLIQTMVTYGMGNTFRIGSNYIYEKSDRKADTVHAVTQQTTKSTGYNIWGWVNFNSTIGAFGRYDSLKLKRDAATLRPKTTRFVGGLEVTAHKNVKLALVADISKTDDSGFVAGATVNTTKFGLYSQVAF